MDEGIHTINFFDEDGGFYCEVEHPYKEEFTYYLGKNYDIAIKNYLDIVDEINIRFNRKRRLN